MKHAGTGSVFVRPPIKLAGLPQGSWWFEAVIPAMVMAVFEFIILKDSFNADFMANDYLTEIVLLSMLNFGAILWLINIIKPWSVAELELVSSGVRMRCFGGSMVELNWSRVSLKSSCEKSCLYEYHLRDHLGWWMGHGNKLPDKAKSLGFAMRDLSTGRKYYIALTDENWRKLHEYL